MAVIRSNSSILKGDELWMFIGTSSTTIPVAFSTSHQLSRSLSTNSVSSKDHGLYPSALPSEDTWTCSTEALMSMTGSSNVCLAFTELMDAYDLHAPVYVTFGKLSNYTSAGIVDIDSATNWAIDTPNWTGTAYITQLQANASHGDTATMSIELQGIGALKKTTA